MTTFQIALDTFSLDQAIEMAAMLADQVQVFEIGTPLVLREGTNAIRRMRERFPKHDILADYKMMDAGDYEAHIAYEAGASIVTVCGAANPETVQNAVKQARKDKAKVMIDMIAVRGLEEWLEAYDEFGADYIQVHTAFDGRGDKSPLEDLKLAKKILKKSKCAVAGGIGLHDIKEIAAAGPDHIILGSRLFAAEDIKEEMRKIAAEVNGV
ncbi:MAG: 3-hexulose-6-phosphate synthase [Eubacteriales bacterium]|nr:3-hexulose-6-phosphate synthase [Eubacteriales bacterium]